jgi:hypothetical protein
MRSTEMNKICRCCESPEFEDVAAGIGQTKRTWTCGRVEWSDGFRPEPCGNADNIAEALRSELAAEIAMRTDASSMTFLEVQRDAFLDGEAAGIEAAGRGCTPRDRVSAEYQAERDHYRNTLHDILVGRADR